MRWLAGHAVTLAVATTAVVFTGSQGAQASTATPPPAGAATASFSGIPSHLAVGGSFTVTVTVKSSSPDRIVAEDAFIGMWNKAQGGFEQTKGITVTFKNPTTGAWEPPSSIDSNGSWNYDYANPPTIAPHGTFTWEAHVTIGAPAKQGTEHVITNGIGSWTLETATGEPTPGLLDYNMPQTTFGYGSGTGSSGGGSGSSAGGSGSSGTGNSKQHTVTHTAKPTHSAARPTHSAPPSHSPSALPSPPASSAAAIPSLAPSPMPSSSSPAERLDAAYTSSSTPLALWAAGIVVAIGLAGGLLARRRVRRQ
ncbi:hypothetical protein [Actinospica robiniae]|uniref:hypothetical protein n=1 Tax=Actinospica robiniae TaxID=304901 RepID=UPI0003F6137F|nr:hypothetical protein [Actinospica robiniae]